MLSFYLKYNKLRSTPLLAPTRRHVRDNSLKTAVNSCNCTTYNAADLAGHAAATLISAPSIAEPRFSSQSLIHSFESRSRALVCSPPSSLYDLFVPDPSQKVGEPEPAQKDLALTHQAGVSEQTCPVVLLLAAAGALLRRLAIILELCPARPVGAITCHPSFTRAWLLHTSCHRGVAGAGAFLSTTRCGTETHKAHLPTYTPASTPSTLRALALCSSPTSTPVTPGDSHPSFSFLPSIPSELSYGRLPGCKESMRGKDRPWLCSLNTVGSAWQAWPRGD